MASYYGTFFRERLRSWLIASEAEEFSQLFGTTLLVVVSDSIPTMQDLTASIKQDVLGNETNL